MTLLLGLICYVTEPRKNHNRIFEALHTCLVSFAQKEKSYYLLANDLPWWIAIVKKT